MDVTVAESGPCRKTITIRIEPDRIREQIDEVYRSASAQVNIKGFRPGKVPRKVLERKYGTEILAEAKEQLVNTSFQDALREHDLKPLGQPKLEGIDETPLDPEHAFEFRVHVDVRPDIELGTVKGIEIKRGDTSVTEDDVQSALAQIADQKKKLQPTDEPAEENDFVKGDLVFKNEAGEVVAERKGIQVTGKIPVAGTDPEAFAAKLRGAEKGATITNELTFPENFEKEEVRGQKGTVELHVGSVMRISAPPIDDDLARSYDFESLEEMKEHLARRIGEEKQRSEKSRREDDVIERLIGENPFEVPESVVEEQAKHNLHAYEHRLRESRVPDEEIERRLREAESEARHDAERRVRVFFLLEAVATKEKVFVTESDIEAELRKIAAANDVSVEQVRQHYGSREARADIRAALMERKVRDFLRENAAVTD